MSARPVVIVTGASRGIGAATCVEFARRGYDVVLSARTEKDMAQVARRVEDEGGKALVLPGDLADLDYAQSVIDQTAGAWGRIDVLVNNAAWREITTMRRISVESWEKTLRISVTAPAFMARWAAAHMEAARRGVIINVSSVQSGIASGIAPAYIAAKGALDSLTYELAITYGPAGIRVVSLRPGAINTEMSGDYVNDEQAAAKMGKIQEYSLDAIPQRRWGTPEESAKTIAWLAGDDASYITGTTICMDGGLEHNYIPYKLKKLLRPDDY
jgi:3-oxoacyl-[acyl-carrier protein] reductase